MRQLRAVAKRENWRYDPKFEKRVCCVPLQIARLEFREPSSEVTHQVRQGIRVTDQAWEMSAILDL